MGAVHGAALIFGGEQPCTEPIADGSSLITGAAVVFYGRSAWRSSYLRRRAAYTEPIADGSSLVTGAAVAL